MRAAAPRWCCARAPRATSTTRSSHGRTATVERIYRGYDDRVYLGVTVDDDPGQDLLRETGRYCSSSATRWSRARRQRDAMRGRHEGAPEPQKQILVAGVGNAWLADDGFGGARRQPAERAELPPACTVMDFGTGGLDLAYEVMRGYHALVLVDVSQQGGEPGDALRDRARPARRSSAGSRTAR